MVLATNEWANVSRTANFPVDGYLVTVALSACRPGAAFGPICSNE